MYIKNIAKKKKKDLFHKPYFFFSRGEALCTYPVLPSSVHVRIYFEWFPLWHILYFMCLFFLEMLWAKKSRNLSRENMFRSQ